ncbi:MAG: hypothetical protein ABI854_09785, partial [Betaproteobacteria bacterium]
VATLGFGSAPMAFAAFKCATKNGVSYQDKPCQELLPQAEAQTVSLKDAERARDAQRVAQRAPKPDTERTPERPKSAAEQRKAEENVEHVEWLERSAKKAESLKRCAVGEIRCNANSLRLAALYLSENQLESALGAPAEKQLLGLAGSSYWKVSVSGDAGVQAVKLVAGWGLCSDDKDYFASGQGPRACKVSIE